MEATDKPTTPAVVDPDGLSGVYIESYGGGFILADYSGNRGEASFCGISMGWRMQPVVRDPFPGFEAAELAREGATHED